MASTDELRILLIRVGPTVWDEAGRLVGSTDLPLSPAGEQWARDIASSTQGPALGTLFVARDTASLQTARVIRDAFGGQIRRTPGLSEVDLGLWEGMLRAEFEEKFPTACRQWTEDPAAVVAPEGESLQAAEHRLMVELHRALARRKVDDSPVGFILRPMAMAIVLAALDDQPTSQFCKLLEDAPGAQWRTVVRGRLAELAARSRADAVKA